MQKGAGYIFFVVMTAIVLTLSVSLTTIIISQNQAQHLDWNLLKAKSLAESARIWQKTSPTLAHNSISQLNQQKLLTAPGLDYKLNSGSFKIVENKGTIYYIGLYRESVFILKDKGLEITPWYE